MSLEVLVATYGYWAILLGTLLEGEMVLVLGGVFAQHGDLTLMRVMAVAFVGAFTGDQVIFHLGRLRGTRLLKRFPRWQRQAERVFHLLRRHQNVVILGFRFCYGFRTISPFAIGTSGIRPLKFLLLDALSATIWAVGIALTGYLIGATAEALLTKVEHDERFVLAAVVLIMLTLWAFLGWRARRRNRA